MVLTNFSSSDGSSASSGGGGGRGGGNTPSRPPPNDPPPKYTPPPSYSTATGARIARMLRQSFRHSVRRIREIAAAQNNR